MRLRLDWLSGAVLVGAVAASPVARAQTTAVSAQGFAIDRFEPAEAGSDWFVLESVDWEGKARPSVGLVLDLANKPLVLYDDTGSQRTVVVNNQFYTHVNASLTLIDRLRFGLSLPVALSQSGDTATLLDNTMTFPAPDAAAIGDIRLSGDVRFFGGPKAAVSLAGGLAFFIPSGKRDQYSGDEKVRVFPRLMLGGTSGMVEYGAKVGIEYRALQAAINGAPIGTELVGAFALGLRLANDRLLIGPELYGSTVISSDCGGQTSCDNSAFSRRDTPIEGILGGHYDLPGGWDINAGIGLGLTRGLGSPALRVLAGLTWSAAVEQPPPPDRDHDGIIDAEDACPDVPGLRKYRGCPPPDRDKDGIVDEEDACPDVPGIVTQDPKTNGCPPPPPDRDGDGIIDAEDACPDVPGVKTDDPKTNGCPPPPPDRDGDGVLDKDDACPDVPGIATNDPKTNGCPPARIENKQIIIIEQVKFKFDSDKILPESDTILNAVKQILVDHPEITKVRVEGHTDNKGTARYNKGLSDRRAKSVAKWLTKAGIDKKRLYGIGFGMEKPIDTNDTDEGRQNNRRVEFHIEQPQEVKP